MSDFDKLNELIKQGINGDNKGIPLSLPKLSKIVNGTQKSMYILLGGNSGTGKTAFVDQVYVLDLYDWWVTNKHKTKIKIQWIYRSMERNKMYKLAKWTCVRLYRKHNILMDVGEILGWEESPRPLQYKKEIDECKEYFDELLKYVDIIAGAENPTGIYKHIQTYTEKHFTINHISQFKKEYIPNDPDTYFIVINDHVGKLKPERGFNKKETIDKHSEYMGEFRDNYGFTIIDISQFNRAIGDTQRRIKTDLRPITEDFKDSSNTQENADLILALFNPHRYQVHDFNDYDIDKFIDNNGNNRFRSIGVLKNSYGLDDIEIGLNFIGECGIFKELPKGADMKEEDYKKAKI
jgi:hypothetical protein